MVVTRERQGKQSVSLLVGSNGDMEGKFCVRSGKIMLMAEAWELFVRYMYRKGGKVLGKRGGWVMKRVLFGKCMLLVCDKKVWESR